MTTQITANNITNNTITATQLVAGALSPKIRTISICDSSYNVLDDTAANTNGGYIQITGSTFGSNSQVIIGTNNATSVTFVNTSTIRAQVPAAAATSYPVYVIDGDTGATAIKINGLTHSSFPAWSTGATLSNQNANTSFGVNLSATADSNITYSNTSALPAGTTLAANGYFSGTVSIGSQTTYSFDVKATDAENQDATRTFSLTVTVVPIKALWNWGDASTFAGLADNSEIDKSSPVQIGAESWLKISAGNYHSAAIKSDGTLWTWGRRAASGCLGLNTAEGKSSPTQVGALTTWLEVYCGYTHTIALKSNGAGKEVWSWGSNAAGELGDNTRVGRSSPVQVGSLTNWNKLPINGYTNSAVIKSDGTLWVWGQNYNGNLGLNDKIYRSSPVQLGADTNWAHVAMDSATMAAIKTNGTLWIWGYGAIGQFGSNNTGYRSSPVQLGADTNWSSVSVRDNVLATKTNGTLWAWGQNAAGQLGLNDRVGRSSPTQVGTGTNWIYVSTSAPASANLAAGYTGFAIKQDGTLWTWGRSIIGEAGLNDQVTRSSPTQVGTKTNWLAVTHGARSTIAISN